MFTVLFPKYLTRPWRKQYKTKKTKNCISVLQIPFEQKCTVLSKIQEKINCSIIGNLLEYDVLWFSSPIYAKYIPNNYTGMVICDDMDDNVSIQTDAVIAEQVRSGQDILFQKADVVFVTSNNLLNRLPDRVKEKAHLIRNGSCVDLIEKVQKPNTKKKLFHVGYLGTISEWFDFELVEKCVECYSNIVFDLFGPDLVPAPQNEENIMAWKTKNKGYSNYILTDVCYKHFSSESIDASIPSRMRKFEIADRSRDVHLSKYCGTSKKLLYMKNIFSSTGRMLYSLFKGNE